MKHRIFCSIKKLAAAGLALFVLFLASCSNLIDDEQISAAPHKPPVEQPAQNGELVTVYLNVAPEARSAFATILREEFTSFELECDGVLTEQWAQDAESGLTAYKMLSASGTAGIQLPAGEHTLTLSAQLGGTTYSDTITKNIQNGTRLSFDLALANLSRSGSGGFQYNLTYPYIDMGITKIAYAMYETEDGKTFSNPTAKYEGSTSNNINGNWSNLRTGVAGGLYIVRFSFYGGPDYEAELGSWEDIVGIVNGKTTTLTDTLTSLNRSYTITYHLNGGMFGNLNVSIIGQYYSSSNPVTLQIPAKTNLDFAGWYDNTDFTGEPVTDWAALSRFGNISLYAKWVYNVTFDSNGTEEAPAEGTMNSVSAVEGTPVVLPKNAFTREGYIFSTWNTLASPSESTPGTKIGNAGSFTATAHTTLYAQWTEKTAGQYAVTFIANGGSIVEPVLVAEGGTLTAPSVSFAHYTLDGWFTSADGGTTLSDTAFVFGEDGTPVTDDITLYAKWTPEVYTITYKNAGDIDFTGEHQEGYATTHTYGTETALDEPTLDGALFMGWYTASGATGTPVTALSATGYTEDITLYAKWLRITWHISAEGTSDGTGSEASPLNGIPSVASKITSQNTAADYEIVVHGSVSTNATISLTAAVAKSLAIHGADGNETDILDGNSSDTILNINTAVPVTLSDIKLTNGMATGTNGSGGGIRVSSTSARLTLASGTLITGNTTSSLTSGNGYKYGAGIAVQGGTVEMLDGAEISANTNNAYYDGYGGGVYVSGGSFIMNGGTIKDNTARSHYSSYYGCGGGVCINSNGGTFEMNGGTISNNMACNYTGSNAGLNYGGAVFIVRGTFKMGGSAYIPYNDDLTNNIKLQSNNVYVNITSALTHEKYAAAITPYYSGAGYTVLSPYSTEITQDIADKFKVVFDRDSTPWGVKAQNGVGVVARPSFSITYKDMYGSNFSGELSENAPVAHTYGGGDTVLSSASKENFVFLGWYTDEDCEVNKVTSLGSTAYSDEITLYAKWHEIETYPINYFDTDSESTNAEFTGVHEEGYAAAHTYGLATTLDTPSKADYTFLGWFTSSTGSGTAVTELTALNYTNTVNLYAKWTRSTFYVSTDGSDTDGDGTFESPFATVANAVSVINGLDVKVDYTIVVNGELFERIELTSSNLGTANVSSLMLRGATGNTVDKLNGSAAGTVLTISTSVPVILRDIAITNGGTANDLNAGGIEFSSTSSLTLESGTLIYENNSTGNGYGSGIAIQMSNGTVTMKDGAVIRDNNTNGNADFAAGVRVRHGTFNMEGGIIENNNCTNNQLRGGAVYLDSGTFSMSGNAYIPYGGAIGKNDVYLTSGKYITVKGELTGGSEGEPVAVITSNSYTIGRTMLTAGTGVTLTQDLADRFAVTDTTPWTINVEGNSALLRRTVYNINYFDNGGAPFTGTMPQDAAVTHTYGTETTLPAPERDGYVFLGWYQDEACEGTRMETLSATGYRDNITLYADWTPRLISFSIVSADITVTKTESNETVTLTPASGYKNFSWTIGNQSATSVIPGAYVNASGCLVFDSANLTAGRNYQIILSAYNDNGAKFMTVISIKK